MKYRDGDPELFAIKHSPSHSEPTSYQAALGMADHAAVQRQQILDSLVNDGAATADELDLRLKFRPTSSGRRLPDLEREGFVRWTGETRKTRSGRNARVYAAVASGFWERNERKSA